MYDDNEKMLSRDLRELHDTISELRDFQKKQSSLRWNFWRGIFYGFGFFIGSAIIAAGLIYILSRVGDSSWFGKFIQHIVRIVEEKR